MMNRIGINNRKLHNNIDSKNAIKNETDSNDNKKLICISPGGFKGFYLSGIIAYIKDNYDTSNFYFSGASAGAWNAILFTYRGNLTEFMWRLIKSKPRLTKNETIRDYKYYMKNTILANHTSEEFDLDRVFIGVTTITPIPKFTTVNKKLKKLHIEEIHTSKIFMKTSIFSKFTTLEDALDCCIASSHVPFFMGRVFHIYDNQISIDGGFSHYPYYPFVEPVLNITPTIWNRSYTWPVEQYPRNYLSVIDDYTTILNKDRYNFWELFINGYEDSHKNRHILDRIFLKKLHH